MQGITNIKPWMGATGRSALSGLKDNGKTV